MLKFLNLEGIRLKDCIRPLVALAPIMYFGCLPKFILFKSLVVTGGLFVFPLDWMLLLANFFLHINNDRRVNFMLLGLGAVFTCIIFVGAVSSSDFFFHAYSSLLVAATFISYSKFQLKPSEVRVFVLLITAICGFVVLQGVLVGLGFFQYTSSLSGAELGYDSGYERVTTTHGGPNATSIALTILMVVLLSIGRSRTILTYLTALGVGVVVFLTYSKGGAIIFMLSILLFAFYGASATKVEKILGRLAVFLLFVGFAVTLALKYEEIKYEVRRDAKLNANFFSSSGRNYRMQQSINYWLESPIIGNGVGSVYIDELTHGGGVVRESGMWSPHNVYVLMLAETGLIGCVFFAGVIVVYLVRSFRASDRYPFLMLLVYAGLGFQVELVFLSRPLIFEFVLLVLATDRFAFPENRIRQWMSR